MSSSRTHYDVLGVPFDADQQVIRKAYLKASLKYHPDKNPNNVEVAKLRFVEIGQAYETLKDPSLRAAYDYELRSGRHRTSRPRNSPNTARSSRDDQAGYKTQDSANAGYDSYYYSSADRAASAKEYDNYRDAFDDFVAGMSESELYAAMGVASIAGSIVGSLVGARLSRNAGPLGEIFGSLAGSAIASQAASNAVRTIHGQSRERIAYNESVRAAIQRGERPPERPTAQNGWTDLLKKVQESMGNSSMRF